MDSVKVVERRLGFRRASLGVSAIFIQRVHQNKKCINIFTEDQGRRFCPSSDGQTMFMLGGCPSGPFGYIALNR